MNRFNFFNGVFSESFQESIEGDSFTLKERIISKFKERHSEDIGLDKIEDRTLMFSNKEDNPRIRNFERKSAYLTVKIRFVNESKSTLEVRIRPNSVYPIIFFTHTPLGIGSLIAMLTGVSSFWGGSFFILSGCITMIFGQISKRNLYNSFNKVLNNVKQD